MNILAIDTSTEIELLAVSNNGIIADRTQAVGVSHSVTLFKHLADALNELDMSAKDIELIGVGTGPGSFTGIRIAVTTARMLAQLLSVPLIGIESHQLYAISSGAPQGSNVLVAFDAKKKKVFGALYEISDNPLEPIVRVEPGDFPFKSILEEFDGTGELFVVGRGLENHLNTVTMPRHTHIKDLLPSGELACRLIYSRFMEKPDRYRDITSVIPTYARKSDAEALRDAKKRSSD